MNAFEMARKDGVFNKTQPKEEAGLWDYTKGLA